MKMKTLVQTCLDNLEIVIGVRLLPVSTVDGVKMRIQSVAYEPVYKYKFIRLEIIVRKSSSSPEKPPELG